MRPPCGSQGSYFALLVSRLELMSLQAYGEVRTKWVSGCGTCEKSRKKPCDPEFPTYLVSAGWNRVFRTSPFLLGFSPAIARAQCGRSVPTWLDEPVSSLSLVSGRLCVQLPTSETFPASSLSSFQPVMLNTPPRPRGRGKASRQPELHASLGSWPLVPLFALADLS